jgi:dTDP-4-amino-4,6-dideoxygalactose transaminase
VDIDPDTYCIDPAKAEAAITPRTKAIIAVHVAGHPADLDALKEISRKHNIFLIEDSAHAHGSEWKGHKVGAIGDIGTFSFQASKLMTAGEGGIIITNDDDLAVRVRAVHDCGRMPNEWFYAHFVYGSNYRLSEWQGAILSQQLARLDEQAEVRSRNADYLNGALAEIEGIVPQKRDPRCTRHGHYCYIFHYDSQAFNGLPTNKFIEALNAEGVPTQASYPPLHDLALFESGEYRKRLLPEQAAAARPFSEVHNPISDDASANTVWMVHRALLGSPQDTMQIVEAVRKVQRHASELKG